jgi:hypothetical protein
MVGSRLGAAEIAEALAILAATPTDRVARRYDIDAKRTRTLAAGAVILARVQERLGTPLKIVRAGLRDGAIRELAASRLAA